jgi:hypothetical protein
MSEIDQYQHQCIGIVACPSTYEIVAGNQHHRDVPLYRVDESAAEWNAKQGDLLLGGGSGESHALRISMPEAILFLTQADWERYKSLAEIYKAYWSMTDAFIFGEGYRKVGWSPQQPIELWLVEHIIAFMLQEYPEIYSQYCGDRAIKQNGLICRLPDPNTAEVSL